MGLGIGSIGEVASIGSNLSGAEVAPCSLDVVKDIVGWRPGSPRVLDGHSDLDEEAIVELAWALTGIPEGIAGNSCVTDSIIESTMGVAVKPRPGLPLPDQVLDIAEEEPVERRAPETRMHALLGRGVMGDNDTV